MQSPQQQNINRNGGDLDTNKNPNYAKTEKNSPNKGYDKTNSYRDSPTHPKGANLPNQSNYNNNNIPNVNNQIVNTSGNYLPPNSANNSFNNQSGIGGPNKNNHNNSYRSGEDQIRYINNAFQNNNENHRDSWLPA